MERKQSSEEGGNVLEAIADGVKNGYLFIENGVREGIHGCERYDYPGADKGQAGEECRKEVRPAG